MKLCKDCKYLPMYYYPEECDLEIGKCQRPTEDYVHGGMRTRDIPAQAERENQAGCGPEGVHWKQRKKARGSK